MIWRLLFDAHSVLLSSQGSVRGTILNTTITSPSKRTASVKPSRGFSQRTSSTTSQTKTVSFGERGISRLNFQWINIGAHVHLEKLFSSQIMFVMKTDSQLSKVSLKQTKPSMVWIDLKDRCNAFIWNHVLKSLVTQPENTASCKLPTYFIKNHYIMCPKVTPNHLNNAFNMKVITHFFRAVTKRNYGSFVVLFWQTGNLAPALRNNPRVVILIALH